MAIKVKQDGPDQPVAVLSTDTGESHKIIAQLLKDKGAGVVMKGSEIPDVLRIPTGMFEFDLATGGGFPRGRLSIIYGPEASGKTNACYCAVANAQRLPGPCNRVVWVDLEGTFDPKWAALFGVDVEALVLVKPAYGEEMVDIVDALVRANDVVLIIVDSIAVTVSTKELEQSVEKFDVGTSAILVKRLCNKLIMAMEMERRRDHVPAVILVNQTRFKIGVMFGDPETMPGGKTMLFLSSLTIRLYGKPKMDKAANPDVPVFRETHAVIKKAKVPVTKMDFDYDMCVYPHGDLSVGQTNSWNQVAGELKQFGFMAKSPKGWKISGTGLDIEAATQSVFQDTYSAEPEFANKLHAMIMSKYRDSMFLVEAQGAAK